jgi:CheY-like chemotaxis protein
VPSREHLLDETALHLHRAEGDLTEVQRRALVEARRRDRVLGGSRVLIIDDDVRNIFAVTSALEAQHVEVLCAESGAEGLDLLERNPNIDAVLMDIMMPEMDGYEVMRRIRAKERFRDLPIIAVTAKAMRADREKCIEAGASDYLAKPVDIGRLLSLLRVRLQS